MEHNWFTYSVLFCQRDCVGFHAKHDMLGEFQLPPSLPQSSSSVMTPFILMSRPLAFWFLAVGQCWRYYRLQRYLRRENIWHHKSHRSFWPKLTLCLQYSLDIQKFLIPNRPKWVHRIQTISRRRLLSLHGRRGPRNPITDTFTGIPYLLPFILCLLSSPITHYLSLVFCFRILHI